MNATGRITQSACRARCQNLTPGRRKTWPEAESSATTTRRCQGVHPSKPVRVPPRVVGCSYNHTVSRNFPENFAEPTLLLKNSNVISIKFVVFRNDFDEISHFRREHCIFRPAAWPPGLPARGDPGVLEGLVRGPTLGRIDLRRLCRGTGSGQVYHLWQILKFSKFRQIYHVSRSLLGGQLRRPLHRTASKRKFSFRTNIVMTTMKRLVWRRVQQ